MNIFSFSLKSCSYPYQVISSSSDSKILMPLWPKCQGDVTPVLPLIVSCEGSGIHTYICQLSKHCDCDTYITC